MATKEDLLRKRRVFHLLAEALEHPTEERAAFLDQACGDDKELRRELDTLLNAEPPEDNDQDLLAQPAWSVHAKDEGIGRSIGHYRLVRLLDRGGMGTVYLAERKDFEQQVALKLIRRGLDLDEVLVRRFHNERQILAHLEHPHIARLLDGGTTGDRLPYFVMEYVEGESIDQYCRHRDLSIEDRLSLFRKVCAAVQFAHQNLVIHRDLKPGNILITSDGEPKLLDFGIAKLLDGGGPRGDATQDTSRGGAITTSGQGPMTPRYASPEQIKNGPITTASDVYSLGVLLYELLTGLDPYDVDTERSDELARAICDVPPAKPSTAVRRRAAPRRATTTATTTTTPTTVTATTTALPREKLSRRLAGDLDSIVLKALRKEPQARYGSADQLSADLQRYLRGLPVEARVGSFAYRARRFVRRHRLPLAVITAFVLLMAGSVLVSTVLWRQAVAQTVQAEHERQRTQQAYDVLTDLFKAADPDEAAGRDLTAFEILERGKAKLIEDDLEPKLEMEVAGILGHIHFNLGNYEEAQQLMEMALASARIHRPGDHPQTAKWLQNLAAVYYALGDYSEAERQFRGALAMRRRLNQPPEDLFRNQNNLASVLLKQGKLEEAQAIFREVLDQRIELYEPKYGWADLDIATSRRSLGAVYFAQGNYQDAAEQLRQSLQARREKYAPEHSKIASVLDLLGQVQTAAGEPEEARALLQEALTIRLKLYAPNHLKVAETQLHLAELLAETQPNISKELILKALETFHQRSPKGIETAEAESLLGALLLAQGHFEEAEPHLRRGHRNLETLRGPDHPRTLRARESLEALNTAAGHQHTVIDPTGD